jgi:hypothetical protein
MLPQVLTHVYIVSVVSFFTPAMEGPLGTFKAAPLHPAMYFGVTLMYCTAAAEDTYNLS